MKPAKWMLTSFVSLAILVIPHLQPALAGPAPIDLKSCAHFAILAASTITGGGSMINGDVGLYPAGSQGIPPENINGTIHNGDAIAAQAQVDLTAAYNAASPAELPGGINLGDLELGGRTLTNGIYKSGSSFGITYSDLTLNGGPDDVWVFQMASTLTVEVGRQVILTGGAQARNIFWQVGSSATLETSSTFKGTIMAQASITMNGSATINGRALARIAAVTYNGNECSLPAPEAPEFTHISIMNNGFVYVVIDTTPYFILTLKTSPDLRLTNWTPIASVTSTSNSCSFTDDADLTAVTQRFYRAYLSPF